MGMCCKSILDLVPPVSDQQPYQINTIADVQDQVLFYISTSINNALHALQSLDPSFVVPCVSQ